MIRNHYFPTAMAFTAALMLAAASPGCPEEKLTGNGRIAFSSNLAGGSAQIYTINADGTGQQQLTTNGENIYPAWSKDGSSIAFTSTRTGSAEIWVMDSDGGNPRQITFDTPGGNFVPEWSHDGKKIAYASLQNDVGHPEVWVMDVDGANQRRLTFTPTNPNQGGNTWSVHPSWSPSGRIAYASTATGNTQIWTMNSDGGDATQLTHGNGPDFPDSNAPEWSRDGNRIVFWSGFENKFGEIWTMNADGTNKRSITTTPNPMNSDNPAWAPDGSMILFDSNREGTGSVSIWTVNADGATPRILASGSGPTAWQPIINTPRN